MLAMLWAPAASGQGVPTALELEPYCAEFPPYSGVKVTASVFPPFLPPDPEAPPSEFDPNAVPRIEAVTSTPGFQFLGFAGAVGGLMTLGDVVYVFTDESGFAHNAFGADNPNTYTAKAVTSTGTLTTSLFVDCAARDPISKGDCKDGGWRALGFRNQGQCVSFANHGKRRHRR